MAGHNVIRIDDITATLAHFVCTGGHAHVWMRSQREPACILVQICLLDAECEPPWANRHKVFRLVLRIMGKQGSVYASSFSNQCTACTPDEKQEILGNDEHTYLYSKCCNDVRLKMSLMTPCHFPSEGYIP